jgi:dienelactone hydrolase
MERFKKQNWQMKTGSLLILFGALSIFPENDTWIHTTLQIIFVTGCILFVYGGSLAKKSKNSSMAAVLIILFTLPVSGSAQDYSQQIEAFEESFHQKEISVIKPFLSDSLKFNPLPIQNTIPVLTNIVTNLPKLNTIKIMSSEKGNAKVKYDFEQLGIKQIEFVDDIIKQQIEQQRKMQSSVQAPKPDKIAFTYSKKEVEFPSKDGLIVSADLYEIGPDKPVMLLAHQGGYNKYEYADIAPRLNEMGFNALAIDQRSGGSFAEKQNETYNNAVKNGIENIQFADAAQDMESAIDYLADKYQQKIIVWGSSYSSSLALHIAEKNTNVKAVISFSPGDYFGESFPSLKTVLPKIKQPFLVTSSREEADQLKGLLSDADQSNMQLQFIPESDGFHGSRALWIDQQGADEYWAAITKFLKDISLD